MRTNFILGLLSFSRILFASPTVQWDHDDYHYFSIELTGQSGSYKEQATQICSELELTCLHQVGSMKDVWLVATPKSRLEKRDSGSLYRRSLDDSNSHLPFHPVHTALESRDAVVHVEKQVPDRRLFKRDPMSIPVTSSNTTLPPPVVQTRWMTVSPMPRDVLLIANQFNITDPSFPIQWHLHNIHEAGVDLNVSGAWAQNVTGKGITVAVIDDGIDHDHPDLHNNFDAIGSYDFNEHKNLPTPALWDDTHGTRCAGEIAAMKNDVCGVGIAYDAKIAGLRVLSGKLTSVDEALAVNYAFNSTQIYSCSWGPKDNGRTMENPPKIVAKAFEHGIEAGRNGRGSIFVFAAGNGGYSGDNCNFDGYTNSIYSITVAAFERNLEHPQYSEKCPAILISMLSSQSRSNGIVTTDWKTVCTSEHVGTSAAAPLASGIYALVLSARPELSWRDVQRLSIENAVPINKDRGDWQLTYAKRPFSHKFGYGTLDAYTIVKAAKTFNLTNPQTRLNVPTRTVNYHFDWKPNSFFEDSVEITRDMLSNVHLYRLEHVTLTVDIRCPRRGDIQIVLTSPNGVVSTMIEPRPYDDARDYGNWTMSSNAHWDEDPVGLWTVKIIDVRSSNHFSDILTSWISWSMTLYGESSIPAPKDPVLEEAKPWKHILDTNGTETHSKIQKPSLPDNQTGSPLVSSSPTNTSKTAVNHTLPMKKIETTTSVDEPVMADPEPEAPSSLWWILPFVSVVIIMALAVYFIVLKRGSFIGIKYKGLHERQETNEDEDELIHDMQEMLRDEQEELHSGFAKRARANSFDGSSSVLFSSEEHH